MAILAVILVTTSCERKGDTKQQLTGVEENLPPELKGLKVYYVATSSLGYVKVAVLPDNRINSTTYAVGKTQETTIIIDPADQYGDVYGENYRTITAKEVIYENDSILIVRK
jgi:hypothetical protein